MCYRPNANYSTQFPLQLVLQHWKTLRVAEEVLHFAISASTCNGVKKEIAVSCVNYQLVVSLKESLQSIVVKSRTELYSWCYNVYIFFATYVAMELGDKLQRVTCSLRMFWNHCKLQLETAACKSPFTKLRQSRNVPLCRVPCFHTSRGCAGKLSTHWGSDLNRG